MAITPMQKVGVLVLQKDVQKILSFLQKEGVLEVTKNDMGNRASIPEEIAEADAKAAHLDFLIQYLSPCARKPMLFREKILGEKIEGSEEEVEKAASLDFSDMVQKASLLEEEENRLAAQKQKIADFRNVLSYWKALHVPLKTIEHTTATSVFLGSVEKKEYQDFAQDIADTPYTFLQKIAHSEKEIFVLLIVHNTSKAAVSSLLEKYRFSSVDFGDAVGTVSEELVELEEKEKRILQREQEILNEKKSLASHLREIKLAADALLWKQEKKHALEKSSGTQKTVFVTGWMPKKEADVLQEKIRNITPYADVIMLSPNEGEEPPVLLTNKKIVKPFEEVLGLFGVPAYSELDPTPFLAPFFAIFFGFCLTDAGYGFLLLVTVLFVLQFFPLSKDMRQMMTLLLYGGISTIILGVLFGGYFGMTPDQLPFLVNPETGKFYGQLFDPVNDLMPKIAGMAFGLGFLHILLGVLLGFINKLKKHDISGAILIHAFELLLLISIAGLFLFPHVSFLFFITLAISCIGIMWGTGPKNESAFARLAFGFLELFMGVIVGWVANLLSYSRLFSLGLATGIIALAFNSIAATLGGMMPVAIGIPVMLIIILFGHALNMGLNLLGAFVHSARLQFVEFFGKFLEGGGQKFSPLSRKTIYLFDIHRS